MNEPTVALGALHELESASNDAAPGPGWLRKEMDRAAETSREIEREMIGAAIAAELREVSDAAKRHIRAEALREAAWELGTKAATDSAFLSFKSAEQYAQMANWLLDRARAAEIEEGRG